jgi:hypothetical protein
VPVLAQQSLFTGRKTNMKAGTVVRFTNRWDETMLMSVLAVDNDWAHCVYYGREGDTKAGWFRTEMLTEEK